MIDKIKNLQKIMDTGVIAVIRSSSQEEALKISEAVKLGGGPQRALAPGRVCSHRRSYPGERGQNGCIAVGVGGELTKGARTGDFGQVTETARAFVSKVRQSRSSQHILQGRDKRCPRKL